MLKYLGLLFLLVSVHSFTDLTQCEMNPDVDIPLDFAQAAGTWHRYAASSFPVTDLNLVNLLACNKQNCVYNSNDTITCTGSFYVGSILPIRLYGHSETISHLPGGNYGINYLEGDWGERYIRLYSDYTNYIIAYICEIQNGQLDRVIHISGRQPTFNQVIFDMAVARLAQLGVPEQTWEKFLSTAC